MTWISSNAGLKLIALALALVTWFFVRAITSDSRTIERVPLEFRLRPGVIKQNANVETVNIVVRGTREDVRQMTRNELWAVIDLTRETRTGLLTFRLEPRDVHHPRHIQVVDVSPSEVTVRLTEATP
jgi:YbbR domain-containing protein